jgi:hypothetical protein
MATSSSCLASRPITRASAHIAQIEVCVQRYWPDSDTTAASLLSLAANFIHVVTEKAAFLSATKLVTLMTSCSVSRAMPTETMYQNAVTGCTHIIESFPFA